MVSWIGNPIYFYKFFKPSIRYGLIYRPTPEEEHQNDHRTHDFFKLGDKFATVLGDDVKVGQKAPEFTSVCLDWSPVNPVAESKGKVAISKRGAFIGHGYCDRETRRFNRGSCQTQR